MTSLQHALKLAGDLAISYPGRNVDENHARAWAATLEPIPTEQAELAVANLRRRSVDPPSVAMMVAAIAEVVGLTMSPRMEQPELGDALSSEEISELLGARKRIPDCRECGVPHITRTHEEYIKRAQEAGRRYGVGKSHRGSAIRKM